MQLIRDFDRCPEELRHSVLALGNFDGVHRGHQAILHHVIDMAKHEERMPAVMTFEPHPRAYFSKGQPVCIYRFRQKVQRMEETGIRAMFVLRFNEKLAGTTARSFVEHILHEQLAVHHVVTGYNFAFGKGREGNTEFLAGQGHRLGFGFTAVPAIAEEDGTVISTSAVRQALAAGDIAKAVRMLGHSFTICGRVMHGDKRGRTLGFPTANISLHKLYAPRFGVYAVRVQVADRHFEAVANLGIKPTVGGRKPLLEVHIFNFDEDIYGQQARVELLHFIRPEQSFETIDALQAQIKKDVGSASSLFKESVL
ncbi:MAG: bifunctional riboflavin kinase/FAD synthetase [Alphaproteobacteria bacterium]